MGRSTRGVKGITLAEGDTIAAMVEVTGDTEHKRLLTVTERGYGKRTALTEYRQQTRGGRGIIDIQTGDRNGAIVGSLIVEDTDRIMLISEKGLIIKMPVLNIRDQSRNTKGVTVMRIPEDDRIVSIAKVLEDEEEETTQEENSVDTVLSTDETDQATE
jgi:DNA gyrase subunit A